MWQRIRIELVQMYSNGRDKMVGLPVPTSHGQAWISGASLARLGL